LFTHSVGNDFRAPATSASAAAAAAAIYDDEDDRRKLTRCCLDNDDIEVIDLSQFVLEIFLPEL